MCGIAAILSKTGDLQEGDVALLESLVRQLKHRGPDAQRAQQISPDVAFGCTRLAITDRSNRGVDMPIVSRDGRHTLIFNGEIYNFRQLQKRYLPTLTSESDSEVLLGLFQMFGADCLKYIEGMYALIVFDRERNELFCAVDPTGQKSLYIYEDNRSFIFSSEILPLITIPGRSRSLSFSGMAEAVARRFIIGSQTHIREISKIPLAHYAIVSRTGITMDRYYSLPVTTQDDRNLPSVIERFHQTMSEISDEIFNTDLPIATLLSGGIDSTSISWMAHARNRNLTAYSIGFEPIEGKTFEKSFGADEFDFSRIAAQSLGIELKTLRLSLDEYFTHFEAWIDTMGEPRCFNDAPALLALFKLIGEKHRVAFCGSGTDEVLDGYSHYDGLPYGVSIESRIGNSPDQVADCYFDTDLRLYGVDLSKLIPHFDVKEQVVSKFKHLTSCYAGQGLSGQQYTQLLMANSRLVNYEFCQLDLTSMQSSVEARSPYGERRFMEFAFSFAPYLKAHEDKEKLLLKEAFKGILPDQIVSRKKSPFPMPMQYFFSKTYEDRVSPYLRDDSPLSSLGLVDCSYIQHLWNQEDPNYRPVFSRLYMLNRMLEAQSRYVDMSR